MSESSAQVEHDWCVFECVSDERLTELRAAHIMRHNGKGTNIVTDKKCKFSYSSISTDDNNGVHQVLMLNLTEVCLYMYL